MKILPIAVVNLVATAIVPTAAVVSAVWTPPIDSMGVECGGTSIKTGDGGAYTCFTSEEAICRDNYPGSFGSWMFVIKDGTVQLLDPNNQVSWQFCDEVSHVCIGEDHADRIADPSNPKFSQQRPYMFFYNEKTQEKVGELLCDGTDGLDGENLDKPSLLKMVDNSMLGGYVHYGSDGIPVVKFKKGQTDDPEDLNSLWQIAVNATGAGTQTYNERKCTWTQVCNETNPRGPGSPPAIPNSCPDVPDQSNQTGKEADYFQCDRQCRNEYGVNRGIVGIKADRIKNTDPACDCTMDADGVALGQAAYETTNTPFTGPPPLNQTFPNAEPFDNAYWCDAYSTPYVCAINMTESGGKPRTFVGSTTSGGATRVPDGWTLLHCGACGACSMPSDIKILYDTRHDITDNMTECSTEFALSNDNPFAVPQTRGDLEKCLIGKGIAFSTDGRASELCGQPTCMDCWVDNILHDKVLCATFCINKFGNSSNAGDFVNDKCLQCDEYTSGPAFIRCAGANRRSTGILSDINRTQLVGTKWDQQTCPVGICSSEEGTESPCGTLPLVDP